MLVWEGMFMCNVVFEVGNCDFVVLVVLVGLVLLVIDEIVCEGV